MVGCRIADAQRMMQSRGLGREERSGMSAHER